ncbi:MAG TPA: SDR family oxidoreductase [Puia sp.]
MKVAIVTGAGQGIGFAICRHLIAHEVRVLLNDNDATLAKRAAAGLGPNCIAMPGDAGDTTFIQHMVDTAVRTFGRLDIAIANAGLTLFGDFFSYPPESFSKVMQLNLAGSFFLAQAAANQMRTQGEGGSILFTSSVTGHQAHKQLAAYGMSKAALEMLARSLVLDLSPYKININAVAPGATLTERTAHDPSYEQTWSTLTPMGRPASVDDIAHAVLFLTSPEARHITGQTLIVDGGWSAVSPGPQ